jgi:hypothetical protein
MVGRYCESCEQGWQEPDHCLFSRFVKIWRLLSKHSTFSTYFTFEWCSFATKKQLFLDFVFSGHSPGRRCHGSLWNPEGPARMSTGPSGFRKFLFSNFMHEKIKKAWKKNSCFFMHVKGLSIDPSRFSAPPLSLLASWWEPQIWKGLYSHFSPIH